MDRGQSCTASRAPKALLLVALVFGLCIPLVSARTLSDSSASVLYRHSRRNLLFSCYTSGGSIGYDCPTGFQCGAGSDSTCDATDGSGRTATGILGTGSEPGPNGDQQAVSLQVSPCYTKSGSGPYFCGLGFQCASTDTLTCVPVGQPEDTPVLSNTTKGGTGNAFQPVTVLPSPPDSVSGACSGTATVCGGTAGKYCCANGATCGSNDSCVNLLVNLPPPDFNKPGSVYGQPLDLVDGGCSAGSNPCIFAGASFCCGGTTPQCGTSGMYCLPSANYNELVNAGY